MPGGCGVLVKREQESFKASFRKSREIAAVEVAWSPTNSRILQML